MKSEILTLLMAAFFLPHINNVSADQRPNLLIVTVDDMSCDSVGAFGCRLADTTPHIDAFADRSRKFLHAHVQVGNCFPSRNVMWSGRYPHNTGVEGFYQVRNSQHPHLVDLMKQAGYFVGIRGKVSHSTPYHPYAWDVDLSILDGVTQHIKDVKSYYESTRRGIEMARDAGKPFCLNVNISDPHKPFYATGKRGETVPDAHVPSRVFHAAEVPVPGFLFEHPDVRRELAQYYSSVRRADDCFGEILRALEESGQSKKTVIIFLSDHGMPLPFAKTALWHHSTHTPLIVNWPGVTTAGSADSTHLVSAVDLLPTILDICGQPHPDGFDGRSFMPLLKGDSQSDRDMVYKVYNENSGGNRSPMRSVQSAKFGYLFNPWSDGKRVFKTATTGTITYRTMQTVAKTDAAIAARLKFFNHGVPEEFYDYENDPDALHNLIDDPAYAAPLKAHRAAMRRFMVESNDPILDVFDQRDDAGARSAYVDRVQSESDARRTRPSRGKPSEKSAENAGRKHNQKLFQFRLPPTAVPGQDFVVTINHDLPRTLNQQMFHVTLKDSAGKRIERIVKSAAGSGTLTVAFDIPEDLTADALNVSVFVGEEYATNLLHRTEGPVKVER